MSIATAVPKPAFRILVADADAGVRESVGKVLREAGYEPLSAVDGQQALAELKLGKIDLLLLDLELPVKNGWQVFEHIVSEHPMLPVIVMTGQANQQFAAAEAGARRLREKPLDVQRLLTAIQELLAQPAEV